MHVFIRSRRDLGLPLCSSVENLVVMATAAATATEVCVHRGMQVGLVWFR